VHQTGRSEKRLGEYFLLGLIFLPVRSEKFASRKFMKHSQVLPEKAQGNFPKLEVSTANLNLE
jgi:hypothetical protein